jgi:hypothetical protein
VAIITFTTFIMSSDDNVLTPEIAFVCLTLFDIIRLPLAMLPLLIVYMAEVWENPISIILFSHIHGNYGYWILEYSYESPN